MSITWRKLITEEMERHNDSWENVVSVAAKDLDRVFDEQFDNEFGSVEGDPFTIWTDRRVYFPTQYDGQEDCGSVSRHPDGQPTEHIG